LKSKFYHLQIAIMIIQLK